MWGRGIEELLQLDVRHGADHVRMRCAEWGSGASTDSPSRVTEPGHGDRHGLVHPVTS